MYTIGELSQAAQVTVKTIRYYQELGILSPVKIDDETGYRYYDNSSYDRISSILTLKKLGFSLKEIQNILQDCSEDEELKVYIKSKIDSIKEKVKDLRKMETQLSSFISQIRDASLEYGEAVEEVMVDMPWIAAVKVEGYYDMIGNGYKTLYKKLGKYIKGSPLAFYYDMEYKEADANFKAAFEVKKDIKKQGVESISLEKIKAAKVVYKGPYGGQGEAYLKLFNYCRANELEIKPPLIERYVKGPGLIFKGNPENYITECIVLVS